MCGMGFPLVSAGTAGHGRSHAEVSRQAAERHALLTEARRRRAEHAGDPRRSIRHRRGLSAILFRLSSRATTLV